MQSSAFRRLRNTSAAFFVAVSINACGEPVQPSMAPPRTASLLNGDDASDRGVPVAHIVRPIETSKAGEIDWLPPMNPGTALHYVWLPEHSPAHSRLFLFMPGTGNRPVDYQLISAEAARAGHHVIGLMYQNEKALEALCKGSTDTDCAEDVRMEMLVGESLGDQMSPLVKVTRGNSIDHRLERLLVYLAAAYPEEGWETYLQEGKPDWSKIAVAGQSMGAGQAALIARERSVPRVAMFSGPPDQAKAPAIDSWVRIGETPASRMFALYHNSDRLKAGIIANMGAEGLGLEALGTAGVGKRGPWCTSDELPHLNDHGFGGAHVLITDLVPNAIDGCAGATTGNPHRSTARDTFTPLLDGEPALRGAWRYLIGRPGPVGYSEEEEGNE